MRFLHDIFQKRCLDVYTFKFGCSQNLIVFFEGEKTYRVFLPPSNLLFSANSSERRRSYRTESPEMRRPNFAEYTRLRSKV